MAQSQDIRFNIKMNLDDEHFYALPMQVPCDFDGDEQATSKRKIEKIFPTLKGTAEIVHRDLAPHLFRWDVTSERINYKDVISHTFNLPPTGFRTKLKIFENLSKIIEREYNEVQPLNETQLKQIRESGTFEIPSKKFPVPYVWQLSGWIVRGKKNIKRQLQSDLGCSFNILYHIPPLFKSNSDYQNGFRLSIRSALLNIAIKPILFVGIIIGFKELDPGLNLNKIKSEVEQKRQERLLTIPGIDLSLYKYLHSLKDKEAKEKFEKLQEVGNQFVEEMNRISEYMKIAYELQEELKNKKKSRLESDEDEKQELIQNIQQQLRVLDDVRKAYNIVIDDTIDLQSQINSVWLHAQEVFWSKSKISADIVQQIKHLTECTKIIEEHYQGYQEELQKSVKVFQENLKKANPIKCESGAYLWDNTNNFRKSIKKSLKADMQAKILTALQSTKISDARIYQDFIEQKKAMKEEIIVKIKDSKYTEYFPSNKIVCVRQCFPPYRVLHDDERRRYWLERTKSYKLDTSFHGWRIYLMLLTWYTWTVNIMFWLFANAISGPMGIRALFSPWSFHPDVTINSQTGEVTPSSFKVNPVIVRFRSVCQGMQKSRQAFESAPDTGFFGKDSARIINLFEVYILRFLFVGVLIVLIISPAIILVNFTVSLALALTSWAWSPIVIFATLLFKIIFFDWDVDKPRIPIWRHKRGLPLIKNIYHLIVNGVLQLLLVLSLMLIIYPLAALVVAAFGFLRSCLRSTYDFFMFQMIGSLGRVPTTENNLAWKISGPGVARSHFYGMPVDQVIVLIFAELENFILTLYQNEIVRRIRNPSQQICDNLKQFFAVFNAQYQFADKGCGLLEAKLNQQLAARKELFPRLNNAIKIRFAENELFLTLSAVKQFIKHQIQLKQLNDCIWDYYQIRKGDYNLLTETILARIFGKEVLEPFEELDQRFVLSQTECQDFEQIIEKALEGQVSLERPTSYQIKQKQEQKMRSTQQRLVPYSKIFEKAYMLQNRKQTWSSFTDKQSRLYLNYSFLANR